MKLYKVDICLKNEDHLETGWLVGRTAVEVPNKIRTQPTVLLASSYRELAETGYNMSEVQGISGYNSSEIVKYRVQEVVADKYDGEGVIAYTVDNIEYLEILED